MTDEELVGLISSRRSAALEELYDRYARQVFSLAMRMLSDPGGAEQVVQEVFTQVWQRAPADVPERGKFSSWLIAIAHRQCSDALRRRGVCTTSGSTDEETNCELATEDKPGEGTIGSGEQERVRRALAQILPEQRLVIELAYFEGLTLAEIAARCGTSLDMVKTRILLGMQKLKEVLGDRSS